MVDEAARNHLREAGYVILRNCLSIQQLRDARNSIEKELRTVTKSSTDEFSVAAIKKYSDWSEECKRLSLEIMKTIPYTCFRPEGTSIESMLTIGVYQPKRGRYYVAEKDKNMLLYTIALDEVINQNNGMPKFIRGSQGVEETEELAQLPEEELELRLGDVLVWEGSVKFICSGTAGAAFMGIAWAAN